MWQEASSDLLRKKKEERLEKKGGKRGEIGEKGEGRGRPGGGIQTREREVALRNIQVRSSVDP